MDIYIADAGTTNYSNINIDNIDSDLILIYRYDMLRSNDSSDPPKNYEIEKQLGKGTFKKFYSISNVQDKVYGRYDDNSNEDNGLEKQKDLKNNSGKNYIPDIHEIGREFPNLTGREDQIISSYVIMERVNGIEFEDLVKFILRYCLIFNKLGNCARFKTKNELNIEGVNTDSVQFKFFSEVILQPLDVRVKMLKYLFQELLNAVNEIHKLGNLHLDIKLPNMMIIYDNTESDKYKKFKVKIIDFGSCKKINSKIDAVGTPHYFSKKMLHIYRYAGILPSVIKNCNKPPGDFKIKFKTEVETYPTPDAFKKTDDIYPLGLILQVMFVLTILTPQDFNKFFYKDGIPLRVNISDHGWNVGLNLGHMVGNFDHIKYIYKNIIELSLLSNDTLPNLDTEIVKKLFHSIDLFVGLKEYLKKPDAYSNNRTISKYFLDFFLDEVDEFYFRNQETIRETIRGTQQNKELFEKIKDLTSTTNKGKEVCQQCFLLLRIFRKMLGTGVSEYNNIGEILDDLNKFDTPDRLVEVQNEELEFVCDKDYSSSTLGGGSRQVGGIVPTKLIKEKTTVSIKPSPAPALSNPQSSIEETQVIDFENFKSEKTAVNKLFQKYYHSSFDMDNKNSNNIFIKPISRIPYVKTEPFNEETNLSKLKITEPFTEPFTEKQKELIKKINSLTDTELQTKLKNHFSVLFPELSESTTQIQGSKEPTKDLDKTIGMIDREVCYKILNDEKTFSGNSNMALQNKLKEAFGFTETKIKKVGGFRKKRQSSKTKKRKSFKTNKRQSSKTNKRKSSTLRNKITLKNKKYKNVSKRKNHLKVNKTKMTKKK